MTRARSVPDIFADAVNLQQQARERLDQHDLRDAAEKSWCATKRATDALVLARTGKEPRTSGQTMKELRLLHQQGPSFASLRLRYAAKQTLLHGACFYDGVCEPEDDLAEEIIETAKYIQDARSLAYYQPIGGADGKS
jgi:hypothetical protein